MNNEGSTIGDISQNTKEYIKLHIDDLKLATVEKLSLFSSKVIAFTVVTVLLSMASMLLVVAVVMALSHIVGVLYALLIVAGAIIALSILVWIGMRRGRFMVDTMVRVYAKLIFEGDEKER